MLLFSSPGVKKLFDYLNLIFHQDLLAYYYLISFFIFDFLLKFNSALLESTY